MQLGKIMRRVLHATIPPALFIGLTAYFGWNAMRGEHGLHSYATQLHLLDEARSAQKDATAEQEVWLRRVRGLKEGALDTDLLDERARSMQNLARQDEIVVPYGDHDHLY
ncbi:septation inhibitor protein [Komagataeibacter rhaeticus]|uniref:Septation inhibitor protein n=1 Tax=Komagataeibacter rhaeticus TaxID=215221 RepID=A0A181CB00_9PROT|nr:septum formation initiator family protein [Komagataeibacter rhaeticus]ATU72570.1 septation inhibitor protein [Komagataeibacter xylinus]KDU94600.1 septation inhibitor protein [Komagataeibacter rhaeticus AF1]MBL7238613.1 septum formation initiator family protein [Komagataeibacter rhaeticus]PYD53645.1 septation inhibitor protein [Komagataeibacter rhaeticus]QIP35515.1 septation inhibitor protein [Komagataeibacter rhaeticus]